MRFPRWVAAALIGVTILAAGGTGFAAFTTSAFVNGSASAGTLGPLTWGDSPVSSWSASNDVCSASVGTTDSSGDTLILSATNLAPGDYCGFADTLYNAGSLPAAATESITSASGGLCSQVQFGDVFFSPSVTIGAGGQTGAQSKTLPADSAIIWEGTIAFSSSASNAFEDSSCSFQATLTGTAGS